MIKSARSELIVEVDSFARCRIRQKQAPNSTVRHRVLDDARKLCLPTLQCRTLLRDYLAPFRDHHIVCQTVGCGALVDSNSLRLKFQKDIVTIADLSMRWRALIENYEAMAAENEGLPKGEHCADGAHKRLQYGSTAGKKSDCLIDHSTSCNFQQLSTHTMLALEHTGRMQY